MNSTFRKSLTLPMLALALSVTGCQTNTTGTATKAGVCSIWLPITYSSSLDSPDTVRQVKGNNAARDAYCT